MLSSLKLLNLDLNMADKDSLLLSLEQIALTMAPPTLGIPLKTLNMYPEMLDMLVAAMATLLALATLATAQEVALRTTVHHQADPFHLDLSKTCLAMANLLL